jgi:hypothetical protein
MAFPMDVRSRFLHKVQRAVERRFAVAIGLIIDDSMGMENKYLLRASLRTFFFPDHRSWLYT